MSTFRGKEVAVWRGCQTRGPAKMLVTLVRVFCKLVYCFGFVSCLRCIPCMSVLCLAASSSRFHYRYPPAHPAEHTVPSGLERGTTCVPGSGFFAVNMPGIYGWMPRELVSQEKIYIYRSIRASPLCRYCGCLQRKNR